MNAYYGIDPVTGELKNLWSSAAGEIGNVTVGPVISGPLSAFLSNRLEDSERLDWLESQHTLHRSVEILYVVDGYEVDLMYDGNSTGAKFHGESLREAIDLAMRTLPLLGGT